MICFDCFYSCGVNWEQHHVSLDCLECGGYSLERPCPICAGHCHNVWKRDLEEVSFPRKILRLYTICLVLTCLRVFFYFPQSHRSGEASWIGTCSSKCEEMGRDVTQMCNRLEKVKATFWTVKEQKKKLLTIERYRVYFII